MRGKLLSVSLRMLPSRITPAGAGKTPICFTPHATIQDHPRRCGENDYVGVCGTCPPGSPPQVRGKLSGFCAGLHCRRITPAGAGKTQDTPKAQRLCRDHPRRCGENYRPRLVSSQALGSPPQVRGKLTDSAHTRLTSWDHPRRCGENTLLPTQ